MLFISLLGKVSHKNIHTYACDTHRPGEKGDRDNTGGSLLITLSSLDGVRGHPKFMWLAGE